MRAWLDVESAPREWGQEGHSWSAARFVFSLAGDARKRMNRKGRMRERDAEGEQRQRERCRQGLRQKLEAAVHTAGTLTEMPTEAQLGHEVGESNREELGQRPN